MIILKNGMMNKKIISLIKSDLFIDNVGTTAQRQLLIEEIKLLNSKNPKGTANTNPGCWRWKSPCSSIEWLMKDIINLLDSSVALYAREDIVFGQRQRLKLIEVDYWANINQPGSRNAIHSHKSAQFSAVYYLKTEGTGAITFANPANIMQDCNQGSPFTRDTRIEPKDGDLLIWPSWMPHEVETNFSNQERINLAFDIKVVE